MGETGWSFESLLPKRQRWRIYGSGRRFRSLGSSPSRSSVTGRRASRIAGRRDGANGPNLRESGPPSGRRTRPSGGGGECCFGRRPQLRGRVNGALGVLSRMRSDGVTIVSGAPGSSRSADRGRRAGSRRDRARLPLVSEVAMRPRAARDRPSRSSRASSPTARIGRAKRSRPQETRLSQLAPAPPGTAAGVIRPAALCDLGLQRLSWMFAPVGTCAGVTTTM